MACATSDIKLNFVAVAYVSLQRHLGPKKAALFVCSPPPLKRRRFLSCIAFGGFRRRPQTLFLLAVKISPTQ